MIDIISTIRDKNLFGGLFKDLRTWGAWIVALKAIFALPMSDQELSLYRKCTGREKPPQRAFKEVYLIVGRRGGKSSITSVIASFLAIFFDYSPFLSPGERGTIVIIGVDKKQCQVIFRYLKAILSLPIFKSYLEREVFETIELSNGINLEVHPSSYRSIRGLTIVGAIYEESAFWRSGDSANPDIEIYRAIKPAMATIPNSILISISTPYSRQGLLYENFREFYGKDDGDVLVWKAPSIVMNPTLSEKMISKERSKDLSAARAEWDAEFREDIEAFLPLEVIERVIISGRIELPYVERFSYHGFFDAAAGGADFFTLAIGHKENEKIIQDLLKARKGNPSEIVKEFSDLLKKYHCSELKGDKFAGSWVSEAFQKEGIRYQSSELNKSEIYLEALPYISSGACELLDNPQLVKELRLLERRRGSSGKDVVDHAKSIGGGVPHDDLANVTAGIIVGSKEKVKPGFAFISRERGTYPKEAPGVLLQRQDERLKSWLMGD
jgi:hypothetical protein